MSAYGFVKCGTVMASTIFWASTASAFLSLLATGLAIASFRLVPSPRPKARILEILAVSTPLLVALLVIASALAG
jgi:hypothetical protein